MSQGPGMRIGRYCFVFLFWNTELNILSIIFILTILGLISDVPDQHKRMKIAEHKFFRMKIRNVRKSLFSSFKQILFKENKDELSIKYR